MDRTKPPRTRTADQSRTSSAPAWFAAAAVAVALVFGAFLSTLTPARVPEVGEGATVLPVPRAISEFQLVDHRGAPFGRAELEGRWSLLFFGYTYCPDVCPITLQSLAEVARLPLPTESADRPQVVFVSVDPDRDTTERLAEYVRYFHPSFVGTTGSPAEIDRLARSVGAFYRIEDGGDREDYLVDHAAVLFLVDPAARLSAVLEDPHDPAEFASLLARIRTARNARDDS